MDLLTHAALGAACAHLALGKKNKNNAWKVGALSALSPDLDLLIPYFSSSPLSIEYWHRNFTHSLVFIPCAAFIVTLILMIVPSFRKNWRITFLASLIGIATHGVLDACTSYGTMLLWPWSTMRVSWDVISIIDPLFTIILVLGAAWSIIFNEKKVVSASLIFACLFLLFNTYQHQRAINTLKEYTLKQKVNLEHYRAMPYIGSSTLWRIIYQQNNCFVIANIYTPLFGNNKTQFVTQVLRFNEQEISFPLTDQQKKDIAIFSWFSDDFLIVANTNPLLLADGRYTMNDHAPIETFVGIKVLPNTQIKRIKVIRIDEPCVPK
jgi:inner membrane protein